MSRPRCTVPFDIFFGRNGQIFTNEIVSDMEAGIARQVCKTFQQADNLQWKSAGANSPMYHRVFETKRKILHERIHDSPNPIMNSEYSMAAKISLVSTELTNRLVCRWIQARVCWRNHEAPVSKLWLYVPYKIFRKYWVTASQLRCIHGPRDPMPHLISVVL